MPSDTDTGLVDKLLNAFERHDKRVAVCPVDKGNVPGKCPKCGATSDDSCRLTDRSAIELIADFRTAVANHLPALSRPSDFAGKVECCSTHCERRQECASPNDCTGNDAGKAHAYRQLRDRNVIGEGAITYDERVDYETQILAAEMEAVRLKRIVDGPSDFASGVAPFGLPMSDADLSRHYEASKRDIVDLVGSEVRQLIGEIRYRRSITPPTGGD